jgi:D-alanine-D-alanine ligase
MVSLRGRIAVACGGDTPEREVSLKSGRAVAAALRARGVDAEIVDVRPDTFDEFEWTRFAAVFIALHGGWGEGGGIQRRLEEAGVRYTGSDPLSSARAMDKWASKAAFRRAGIAVPNGILVEEHDPTGEILRRLRDVPAPWVVKPRDSGSSVGVRTRVTEETLQAALAEAFRHAPAAIVEQQICGRELTVGILGGRPLPVVEIIPARGFFDYEAKYHDPRTRYDPDPRLEEAVRAEVARVARRAHRALRCNGVSRVDVLLAHDATPYVLEVNTVPGLTERSLLPMAAARAGISFPDLCLRILRGALRHA